MKASCDLRTSITLLNQLRDWENVEAWKTFVERYRPLMVRWGRRRGLSLADAEEVADLVLSRVPRALQSFEHDGRDHGFRSFLCTAVRNAVSDLREKQGNCPGDQGAGGSNVLQLLHQLKDPAVLDELEPELGDAASELNALVNEVVAAVRARLKSPNTWPAFERHCLLGQSARRWPSSLASPKGTCMCMPRVSASGWRKK